MIPFTSFRELIEGLLRQSPVEAEGRTNIVSEMRDLVIRARDPEATLAERHEAFCGLVRIFQDMAYACAYAVLGDFHLAENAAQEAFISAWQRLDQLHQPEAFPGWFRRIVLTECNRRLRGQRLQTTSLEDGVDLRAANPAWCDRCVSAQHEAHKIGCLLPDRSEQYSIEVMGT